MRLREELAEDYRRMIYAESRMLVEQARRARRRVAIAVWTTAKRARESAQDRRVAQDGVRDGGRPNGLRVVRSARLVRSAQRQGIAYVAC